MPAAHITAGSAFSSAFGLAPTAVDAGTGVEISSPAASSDAVAVAPAVIMAVTVSSPYIAVETAIAVPPASVTSHVQIHGPPVWVVK